MNVDELNNLNKAAAFQIFGSCCTSDTWIAAMEQARPFKSVAHTHQTALDVWTDCSDSDFLQAFEGHPKIGDVSSLRKKYASTKGLAINEQSGVNVATEKTLQALSDGNNEYDEKNGFIFIVYATGKSAAEMLAILNARLPNDRATELKNASVEQSKITALRIDKLFGLAE
ncbi:MAG: 2-oxo-4-hydroxy-4-carboxy-5-ureidoimidazoline decarboxylase [Crocinitomicaceae bacterium]|jgi:2-oxo-4-hydroxy-4-carboxy-5-ureidoimidazoline decarboxylase